MRVLIVHPGLRPEFSVADVFQGWEKALTAMGCEVARYNTNDRLMFYFKALVDTGEKDEGGHPIVRQAMNEEQAFTAAMQGLTHACYTFWPDVVLFISGFFLKAAILQVMKTRRHKLVMIHTESPYQDEEQLDRAAFMSLNVLNDPVNLALYTGLGSPAMYIPHAYDPLVHYPRPAGAPPDPQMASDVAFVGTAFPSRAAFMEQMDFTGIDLLLSGSDWLRVVKPGSPLAKHLDFSGDPDKCVPNTEAARAYRAAKLGINIYRREAEEAHAGEGWAMGPREVEMAACGLPFLRDPRGENEEVLPMLPAFSSPEEASRLMRWWLSHDTERERAASLARDAVADRTFSNHARKLLAALEKI